MLRESCDRLKTSKADFGAFAIFAFWYHGQRFRQDYVRDHHLIQSPTTAGQAVSLSPTQSISSGSHPLPLVRTVQGAAIASLDYDWKECDQWLIVPRLREVVTADYEENGYGQRAQGSGGIFRL